jgi:stage V sporulation protein G
MEETMQITDIKIRKLFNDDAPMKAIVSVTFDHQLALHDIKVIYAKEKFFVVMPSKKNPDNTYRDIAHPISSDFRKMMEDEILSAYQKAVEEADLTESEDAELV